MSEQQTEQDCEQLAEEVQETIPAEPARPEYESPKLTRHGTVKNLTSTIFAPGPIDGILGPPFGDFS